MITTDLIVSGMTCNNCVAHLTEELMEIEEVSEVSVNLVAGGDSPVTITSDGPLEASRIAEAVQEAGYQATF